jgi:hypothetical protein
VLLLLLLLLLHPNMLLSKCHTHPTFTCLPRRSCQSAAAAAAAPKHAPVKVPYTSNIHLSPKKTLSYTGGSAAQLTPPLVSELNIAWKSPPRLPMPPPVFGANRSRIKRVNFGHASGKGRVIVCITQAKADADMQPAASLRKGAYQASI